MTHAIAVSDEDYLRLTKASEAARKTPEEIVAGLIGGLPLPETAPNEDEYDRRWREFMDVVGSSQQGQPVTSEEIDELIGEEAAATHATDTDDAGASA